MNYSDRHLREIASYATLEVMLADVAIRIELSPTDCQLASQATMTRQIERAV